MAFCSFGVFLTPPHNKLRIFFWTPEFGVQGVIIWGGLTMIWERFSKSKTGRKMLHQALRSFFDILGAQWILLSSGLISSIFVSFASCKTFSALCHLPLWHSGGGYILWRPNSVFRGGSFLGFFPPIGNFTPFKPASGLVPAGTPMGGGRGSGPPRDIERRHGWQGRL